MPTASPRCIWRRTALWPTLSLDFFDYMRAPDIERAVVDLEKQIHGTHPEVSAIFVKPQSVQDARARQSDEIMSPDFVLREDVLTGG